MGRHDEVKGKSQGVAKTERPIAQVDLDGTLCDFDGEMVKALLKARLRKAGNEPYA